jgi:hypothetical protein
MKIDFRDADWIKHIWESVTDFSHLANEQQASVKGAKNSDKWTTSPEELFGTERVNAFKSSRLI